MIEEILKDILNDAKKSEIKFSDGLILRIGFTLENEEYLPKFKISNKDKFINILNIYVEECLKFYSLEKNYDNIKMIITYMFCNISLNEANSLEDYLIRRINFFKLYKIENIKDTKLTSIGNLNYEIKKQSIMQETPYGFNSYFKENDSVYYLPRISFGISDDICYIYSIQNKDTKLNTDEKYNYKVKNKFNTINSGVKEYRNVTPSFVVALTLFLSYLSSNGIDKICIKTPLPLRQENRKLVNNYKIKLYTMKADVNEDSIENFKKEIENKRLNDEFNSTTKFINTFNRLKIHFDNIFIDKTELNRDIIMKVIDLSTNVDFLKEIIKKESELDGKISKYSSR